MMQISAQSLRSPDGRVVLELPDLHLQAGECWLVLGPNGAGKSTFLRHAAGQSAANSLVLTQHWRWQGRPLPKWHDNAWAQQRAYLPQQHHLRSALSVEAIVRMGAFPWQGVHAQLTHALVGIIEEWDLQHLRHRSWTTLSGGEQQRVQLARTALQLALAETDKPRLWLLDEPLAALDLRHQAVALSAMQQAAMEGALVVASVHDMNAALAIASHVLVLGNGAVLWQGAVQAEPVREALAEAFSLPLVWATWRDGETSGQWLVPRP